VGLRSGDLKAHSLMSFAVLSRNGERDLFSILQLLHNLRGDEDRFERPAKVFYKNITSPNTGQTELFPLTDPATLHKTVPG
jgi:hypothetical protein